MMSIRDSVVADERRLQALRDAGPHFPFRPTLFDRLKYWGEARGFYHPKNGARSACAYCGRKGKRRLIRVLIVNPISLRRSYGIVCKRECLARLRAWEGEADARRRRAQYDWERENPTVPAARLISHIPPQYPSVSRATLRTFLDSDDDAATVGDGESSVQALNGSIRSLGFADRVFAEQRSDQVVLRRVAR